MGADAPVSGSFIAGTCLGACVALALAHYASSSGKRRSWKEWWQRGAESAGGASQQGPLPPPLGYVQASAPPPPVVTATDDDDIVREQFTRNVQIFGEQGQSRVHGAFVIVIGLGGVGSHAASMLLRSGVGRLRIIDFDQVSLSSLNRHAVATREDVGTPKAACMQRHFARIFPEAQVDARALMFDSSTQEEILAGGPDFVLDCIDNIDTKVALLAACHHQGLRVVSATGAGGRADPTRIRVADLAESTQDPLSRAVRMRLRRQHGIQGGIPVVFSTETPKAGLLPFEAPGGVEANPAEYQVVPGFRVRIIPVLGSIPAAFGLVMASYVVTYLAGLPVHTEPVLSLGVEHYALLHRRLIEREEFRFGNADAVDVDLDDVAYVARELWRGRSARNQRSYDVGRGMWRSMGRMCLTRWDAAKPPTVDNLIMLTFDEAEEHEARDLEEVRTCEPGFYGMVTIRLNRAWIELGLDRAEPYTVRGLQAPV